MQTMLYLECASGISGDMTVAALLDLGADEGRLRDALASLPVDGFEVRVSRVEKNGIDSCDFDVVLDSGLENHDHDMDYLYGHLAAGAHDPHGHGHVHGDGHHDGGHHHGHGGHHEHRTLSDVMGIIDQSRLTPRARDTAARIFGILADAEAAAHGKTRDTVHFHEVGAVDSIVDIVSVAVCLDDLGIERVVVGPLSEGSGTIRTAHGILPVPVPAVAQIAQSHRLPLHATPVAGELVTPTGAAVAAAIRTDEKLPRDYVVLATGTGAGKRDHSGSAGVLRAFIVQPVQELPVDRSEGIWKIECDIDDCSGEALGQAVASLLDAGALEAHYLPIFTKKNRPAWQLQVVCDDGARPDVESAIFEQTTTIGLRRCWMDRTILDRSAATVETRFGPIQVKQVTLPSGEVRRYPEHDSVAAAAQSNGVSYQQALSACRAACDEGCR